MWHADDPPSRHGFVQVHNFKPYSLAAAGVKDNTASTSSDAISDRRASRASGSHGNGPLADVTFEQRSGAERRSGALRRLSLPTQLAEEAKREAAKREAAAAKAAAAEGAPTDLL